jgi:hypothetical protein
MIKLKTLLKRTSLAGQVTNDTTFVTYIEGLNKLPLP